MVDLIHKRKTDTGWIIEKPINDGVEKVRIEEVVKSKKSKKLEEGDI